jgi:lambda family phage portal protein
MPNAKSPTAGGQDLPAEADPGSLLDLRGTGAKLELWDPQHPSANFDPYANRMAHYVAMGWGLSYATLTGDVSQSNYSSTKVGQQPERDHFRRLQSFIIDHVIDRLYRDWLAMALLNQKIPGITDYNVDRWTNVVWQPRGWQSPDPLKDAQASLIMVAAAADTLTNIAAQDGRDLEEIAEERQSEIKMLKSYGVDSVLPIAKPKGSADTTSGEVPSTTDVSGEAPSDSTTAAKPNGNGKTPPGRVLYYPMEINLDEEETKQPAVYVRRR